MRRIIEVNPHQYRVVQSVVKLKMKKGGGCLTDDTNVTHDWEELTILSFFCEGEFVTSET